MSATECVRMNDNVKLLSRPVNYAVVHLPGRISEAIDSLEFAQEPLLDAQRHYEKVCAEAGIGLPYPEAAEPHRE